MDLRSQISNADLIMVSDVHLRSQDDLRSRCLVDLLKTCQETGVKNFILLGDIFEFFVGSSPYFQKKFSYLAKQLEELARSGCRVFFFEGNHEFHLDALSWQGVETIKEGEQVISVETRKGIFEVVCAHGDLVYAPRSYLLFRGLVKSSFVHFLAKFIPQSWLDRYALGHAKVSRATDYLRTLDQTELKKAFGVWQEKYPKARLGLFGHFHTSLMWQSQQENGSMIFASGPSWSDPSLILLKDGNLSRVSFQISSGSNLITDQLFNYG